MRLLLMGTGGADGIPAIYSDSRVSRHARRHGGKDVRSRSAALIDGHLKIDFGPDTWAQTVREGLDARDWSAVVFTHADADHLAVEELQYCLYPFNDYEAAGFAIYGNNRVVETVWRRYPDWPLEVVQTESFVAFDCCGYRVTPIRAKHGADGEDAHNLIVQRRGKTLLYATDTGVWDEPTWDFLRDFSLDLLVLECTEGFVLTPYNGHLDIEEFRQVVTRLRETGPVSDATKVVTTHHSHNGEATHEELEAAFGPEGVIVGYDGLVIDV
jgi:phosphoribosyl 1,2-cyclic phosphate phosphodiesterase